MSDSAHSSGAAVVAPLFPLPNIVLFPRAVLPLHIFEDRYKRMTADALEGDRRIAMALLKPGWEKSYYQRPAVEPVVCIGTILSHERLADGKYNVLLQGRTRARIVRECGKRPYRVAELQPLCSEPVLEIDLGEHRQRLMRVFGEGGLSVLPVARQFLQMLSSPLPTVDIADLVAFNFIEDVLLKQLLLDDCDVRRRVGRIVEAVQAMRPMVQRMSGQVLKNPSMN